MKNALKICLCLGLAVLISGCIVRTYKQVREREDQTITGNRGFIQGNPPPAESKSPKTRETVVVEVEMRSPFKIEFGKPKDIKPVEDKTVGNKGYIVGGPAEEEAVETTEVKEVQKSAFETYIVKTNDTLQKISKQFYNTVKKWNKIYEANKEKIKDPNRIKPGLKLDIPQD